jgi:hypothetical protein
MLICIYSGKIIDSSTAKFKELVYDPTGTVQIHND